MKIVIGILKFLRVILFIVMTLVQPILDLLFRIFFGLFSFMFVVSLITEGKSSFFTKAGFYVSLISIAIYFVFHFIYALIEIKNEEDRA